MVFNLELLFKIFQYIGSSLAVIGSFLVAYKKISGFYLWTLANSILLAYSVLTAQWGLLVMYLIFLVTTILGIINWRKTRVEKNPAF